MMWGVYEGREGVWENFMVRHMDYHEPDRCLGIVLYHVMTSGVIEVAEDGETARATWLSPGMSIWPDVNRGVVPSETDLATVDWANIKYGMDYIREGGNWYWLHQRVYSIFGAPYENAGWIVRPSNMTGSPLHRKNWRSIPSPPATVSLIARLKAGGAMPRAASTRTITPAASAL